MSLSLSRIAGSLLLLAVAAPQAAWALAPDQQSYFSSLSADQQTAVGAELSSCPSCSLERLADGSPNVIVPSAEASVGVAETAPLVWGTYLPPRGATCADVNTSLSKDASYDKTLGNTLAGLYFRTRSTSTTVPKGGTVIRPGRRYTAHAEQAVGGKLIGFSFDVVRAEADSAAETAGLRSLTSKLLARSTSTGLLQTVDAKSSSSGGTVTLPSISSTRTFWNGAAGFTVGPFPVTLSAALKGQASHAVNGVTSTTEAYVSGNPNTSLYVTASAALEAYVAAVGADAQLTLLSGSLPTTSRMAKGSTSYGWKLQSTASFNALSGYIKAWVRVGYSIFSKTWRHTITSWSGFNWSTTLFTQQSSFPICGATAGIAQ